MSQIRFLVDEDTNPALARGLRARQPDIEILVVGEEAAPPRGTKDPEILHWIKQEGYILVSSNRSTMSSHLRDHLEAGGHIPGILLLRPNRPMGEIIDALLLIWGASSLEEYQDGIEYIPL